MKLLVTPLDEILKENEMDFLKRTQVDKGSTL